MSTFVTEKNKLSDDAKQYGTKHCYVISQKKMHITTLTAAAHLAAWSGTVYHQELRTECRYTADTVSYVVTTALLTARTATRRSDLTNCNR